MSGFKVFDKKDSEEGNSKKEPVRQSSTSSVESTNSTSSLANGYASEVKKAVLSNVLPKGLHV